jgi:hypothetical protein
VKGWTLVYTDNHGPRISITKQLLEAQGMDVILINKQDSSYLFGVQELYVTNENALKAIHVITKLRNE